MPDELQTKTDAKQIEQKKADVLQPGIKRVLWSGGGLLVVLLIFTFALPAGRILFFTGSLLSLVTLVVIALQAVIYSRQWKAMTEGLAIERAKTNPRLRVSEIRIENFEAGQSPIFITTIANDGFIDATGVELHIGIKLGHSREFNWIEPQMVVIPARGQESYPIVTGASLSEQDMEDFKANVPIEVKVRIKYWPGSATEPTEFCYRYLPWPTSQRRPDDVRQFFPCSFNPRLNIGLRIQGGQMKMTAGNVTLTVGKTPPEEIKPEDKTDAENENEGQ